jgi:hypothetical protein
MRNVWSIIGLAFLLSWGMAAAQKASPAGASGTQNVLEDGLIFNIVEWDGEKLPPIYERSDQLPLTLADVKKLSDNKFGTAAIIKMIQERRCACDASVDALVELKVAGVPEEVVQAVSLHSLPPNRSLRLAISVDFEGLGGGKDISNQARRGYIYLIVPDGDRERVFSGNLNTILAGKWRDDTLVDRTDLLLPKKVRRVVFTANVPLKTYGGKEALVFVSTKPDIYTSADIPAADRAGVKRYKIAYPESSLLQICALNVLFRQDQMLPDTWHFVRSHFECEWD